MNEIEDILNNANYYEYIYSELKDQVGKRIGISFYIGIYKLNKIIYGNLNYVNRELLSIKTENSELIVKLNEVYLVYIEN